MIHIRQANIQDASAICKISSDDLGYECKEEFVSKRLNNLDADRESVFIAEIDGVVVGYIHAERYELLYYETMINILGIAVSLEYRRRGVGKALMEYTEKWAKKEGISIIRLNSGGSRTGAHEFYRAIGFNDEKMQMRFIKNLD